MKKINRVFVLAIAFALFVCVSGVASLIYTYHYNKTILRGA